MKNKELKFMFILFFISLFLRVIFFDTSYFIWDETVYLMQGKLIAGDSAGYEEASIRPPLVPMMLSLLWKLFPDNYELLSRALLTFLNSFIIFPVYFLGRLVNKKTAILSSVLISLLPASIINSRYVLTDHLGAVLALTAFVLFFIGTKHKEKSYLMYIGSFVLALAILTKFTNLLMLI